MDWSNASQFGAGLVLFVCLLLALFCPVRIIEYVELIKRARLSIYY